MLSSDRNQDKPAFFNLLTKDDQKKYWNLKKKITYCDKKYKKTKRLDSFKESFNMIREYCVRNDSSDWKRYLVCGICWLENNIAINNRQLQLLVNKCKSSINNSLLLMGYTSVIIKSSLTDLLLKYIPFLKGNFYELRQWTIRTKIPLSLSPARGNLQSPVNLYLTPQPTSLYTISNRDNYINNTSEKLEVKEIQSIFGIHTNQNLQIMHNTQKQEQQINHSISNKNEDEIINHKTAFSDNYMLIEKTEKVLGNTQKNIEHFLDDKMNEECKKSDNLFYITYYINNNEYNFLTDPCCCCPVDWETQEKNTDNIFSII